MNVQYEGVKVQLDMYIVTSLVGSTVYIVQCTIYTYLPQSINVHAGGFAVYVQLHILSTLTAVFEGGWAVHVPRTYSIHTRTVTSLETCKLYIVQCTVYTYHNL